MDVIDVQAVPTRAMAAASSSRSISPNTCRPAGRRRNSLSPTTPRSSTCSHAARGLAQRHGMLPVHVSAGDARLHMLQDVFFAVARALPWDDAAAALHRGTVHPQRLRLAAPRRRPDDARAGAASSASPPPCWRAAATNGSAATCGTTPHLAQDFRVRHAAPVPGAAGAGGRRRWTRRSCNGCAGKRSVCRSCASTTSPRASAAPTRGPC